MKISMNWIKDFVTIKPPVERIAEQLTMAGLEVESVTQDTGSGDTIFSVEVTSNRPDWLSHWGVAREIAAIENLSLKEPATDKTVNRAMPPGWKVKVRDQEACPYYTAVYVEGIQHEPTPDFIRQRLEACGIRSINLIVDITNYVLLEIGQPLHAFDADRLKGQEIIVRAAKHEESFTAIDGSVKKMTVKDLVIADAQQPIALAGIMGGKDSEVRDTTRNILLESAYFHPRWVRSSSKGHALSSESSYRFERRVDPQGVDYGRERALELIRKYAKPRFISGVLKAGQPPAGKTGKIILAFAEIQKKLGVEIKPSQVLSILTRLGLDAKQDGSGSCHVGIPSFRSDLTQPIDLIEEIARIYGFDQIPETLPAMQPRLCEDHKTRKLESLLHAQCVAGGYFETVTFSLISEKGLDFKTQYPDVLWIVNPQHQDLKWLRPTLLPSLLGVIEKNIRGGQRGASFYEIANVYARHSGTEKNAACREEKKIALMTYGNLREANWLDGSRHATLYDLKGMVAGLLGAAGAPAADFRSESHPLMAQGACESVTANGVRLGWLGEVNAKVLKEWDLDFNVFYAELGIEQIEEVSLRAKRFKDIPRFPSIQRDLSITVEKNVKAGTVNNAIRSLGQGLITGIELFDLFEGGRVPKGFKNLAFRITYQSPERTLTSEEIQGLHTRIADEMVKQFKASFQD
ncbi:MAG: phenylalanine--tRNA ligase subunit beta [Omnitrophica bacterium GWA2_52_8]|nr:MAG: phenylalanine--tRNA ligase subunit beta [Omnitrophica bacterium GWA2_52_8]